MELAGQPFDFAHGKPFDAAHGRGNRGYAMAALLVAMSVMAVLMSALLPVWSQMATREKEEELIFRGKQYARAIGLFQRKFANTPPPTIDILVEQRFLRKKYKDPITKDDFQPLYANQAVQMAPGGTGGSQRPGQQTGASTGIPAQQTAPLQAGFGSTGIGPQGGIIGVTSKSKDSSIKIYNGRSRYNEWAFVYVQTAQRPGQSGPGGMPGAQQPRPGAPGPFGMPNGPGQRPNGQPPPGFGQPNRPPIGGPNQFQNPNGQFTTPNGSTTFTPLGPAGQRRPGGQ
jgi:type II secretory pathway pseudopilin PulG